MTWWNHLKIKSLWCWRWTSFATQKLSWKSRTKSCLKWSNIWVEKNNVWNSTRISTRATLVFNIHKWSSWWNKFIVQNICRWSSLFSKVYNKPKSASKLNDELEKISCWAYQWKMLFNPDPNKQANEVIFS